MPGLGFKRLNYLQLFIALALLALPILAAFPVRTVVTTTAVIPA